jgi:serine/threonine protein kinase
MPDGAPACREVEAVALLDHPHIVTVYGSEELHGEPVLVMRWIDGEPFGGRPISATALSMKC